MQTEQNEIGFKTIISKFNGICRNCENPFNTGEEIRWKPGIAVHPACESTMPKEETATEVKRESKPLPRIPNGTYTIVFENGDYQTIRFEVPNKGPFEGRRIASFLSGPDNESHYTGFAFITDDNKLHPWKRFQFYNVRDKVMEAVRILYRTDEKGVAAAGEAYALQSGKCCKCGRKLTVPASIHQGMGPKCSKMDW